MAKKTIQLTESVLRKIVSKTVKKLMNEGFSDGQSIEEVIMSLYKFGAELNMNKDAANWSIRGIGSVIMESCKKIMELYKKEPVKATFDNEFNKKAREFGELKEDYNPNPSFWIEDEGDGSVLGYYNDDKEAIEDAKEMAERARPYGRFLVKDRDENVIFDTDPSMSYKI